MAYNDKTLGDVVRAGRLARGVSLRDLARRVSKTPSYLSDIENDRRVPSEAVLRDLADQLEISFDELMGRAGRMGDNVERYLRRHPSAGVLLRRITDSNLDDRALEKLIRQAETFGR